MSRFVRPSKYRHVYGNAAKKEGCYDNIKVSNNAWDTNLIAANGRYISVNWNASGGGAFAVVPTSRTGKLPDIFPLCRGHTATVLDTCFNPFDDAVLASASDDGTVGLWRVDDDLFGVLDLSDKEREAAGGVRDLEPLAKIQGGGRKIGQVLFHPTASGVLAAATGDHVIKLLDVESRTPRVELKGFTDSIQSLDFDWTGDTLVATCRDRKLRLFDARKGGEAVQVTDGHGGIKGARVAWCGSLDRIITTGFSKMADRQLFLWDTNKVQSGPVKSMTVDSSNGVIMPFWSDNNIAFLAGKGDGNIRYYELESDELHYLTEFGSTTPQRGLTFIPRRDLNANENEIARAYKVAGNMVQPISFLVPRRAESFQSDIFPPAPSNVAALSADDFFGGKSAPPNLVSLEDGKGVAALASTPVAKPTPSPVRAAAAPTKLTSPSPVKPDVVPPLAAAGSSTPTTPTPLSATPSASAVASSSRPDSAAAAPAAEGAATATAPPSSSPATLEPARERAAAAGSGSRENGTAAAADSLAVAEVGGGASTAAAVATSKADVTRAGAGTKAGSGADEDQVAELQRQLAQRDARIRELEQLVERLETNQARVREVLLTGA